MYWLYVKVMYPGDKFVVLPFETYTECALQYNHIRYTVDVTAKNISISITTKHLVMIVRTVGQVVR
jgi:hypothetical protein